jgi:hypothetical protein
MGQHPGLSVRARRVALIASAVVALTAGCGGSDLQNSAGSAHRGEFFDRSNWDSLQSDPDDHKGASVDIVGQLLGAPERDEKGTYWQMLSGSDEFELNAIVALPDPDFQIGSGDYVRVQGTVIGAFEGQNALGGDVVAVGIAATSAERVDATAAASEAEATISVNDSQTQHDVTVTLDRIEFATDETRVFITVTNDAQAGVLFQGLAKAVQGSRQYDAGYSQYPEVPSSILPGVVASGVIVFPPMDPTSETRIVVEAQTEDFLTEFRPYSLVAPAAT